MTEVSFLVGLYLWIHGDKNYFNESLINEFRTNHNFIEKKLLTRVAEEYQ